MYQQTEFYYNTVFMYVFDVALNRLVVFSSNNHILHANVWQSTAVHLLKQQHFYTKSWRNKNYIIKSLINLIKTINQNLDINFNV